MESIWAAARDALASSLTENNFKLWIDPLQPMKIIGQTLYLGCPNQFFLSWVREKYQGELDSAVNSTKNQGFPIEAIEFEVSPPPKDEPPREAILPRQQELPRLDVHKRTPLRFNPRFTFDRFIVGQTNQLAYSAAQAMAWGRELNTNSLFILSDHGLGKSHLSQAVGQQMVSRDTSNKVYYLTAEDFTNEMVYSIKNRCTEEFKNKYRRNCDVLVLEEIHFLSGKERIQSELCYTLDNLLERDKKVVMTSAALPKDIPRLGRQFSSRLSNSLISTIEAPDYDTRFRILEFKARENGLAIRDEVLDFMARRLKKDIRRMESCLNSLGVKSRLLNKSIDLALAEETLSDLIDSNEGVSPEAIRELVCRHYQVSMEDLRSKSRKKSVVLPRNLGMYLCRKMTDLSLEEIGEYFGRKHSTVLYSVNLIENRSRRDPKLKGQVEFLTGQIGKHAPSLD